MAKIPTFLPKVMPPTFVRGMREFQGGASYGGSRKVYVSTAPAPHIPFTKDDGEGPQGF